jgi:excisionase family DNA binding protein
MSEQKWMTVDQLVRYLQVSRTTVYDWMREGQLPYRELPGGRGRRFDRADVDKLLAEPTPRGQALVDAIVATHREMNARWDQANEDFRQIVHLLRSAASGESLQAAAPDGWLRRAAASNPVGTENGRLVRGAARLLRAYVSEWESRLPVGQ